MGLKGEEPSPDPPHLVSWGLPVDDDHVLQYDSATAAYGSVPAAALHSLYSKQHSRSSIPHRQPRTSLPPASLSDAADPVPADGNATSAGGGGGGGSVSSGGAVASSNVASVGADGGGGGAAASSSVAASSDGGAVTSAVGGGVAGGTVVSGGGAAAVGTSSGPVDAAVLHSNASAATRAGHGNAAGNSSAALSRTVSRGAAVADGARR